MANVPIRWIEARTYCHATEDESRVEQALSFVIPNGTTVREPLEGHFGNHLVRLIRRVENRSEVRALWERWSAAGLGKAISGDVDARVDEEGILHFRLDKQAAFQERIDLATDSDIVDVRLKLIAYPAKTEMARRAARSIVEGAI